MKNAKNTILTIIVTTLVITVIVLGFVGIGFVVVKNIIGFIIRFAIIFTILCYKEYRKNHKKNF